MSVPGKRAFRGTATIIAGQRLTLQLLAGGRTGGAILTTTDSLDLARRIALALVETREAACVNVVNPVHSVYRWEGRICEEDECLLLVKSTRANFDALCATIRQIHTYSVPEIIALDISGGDKPYLDWLRSEVLPRAST
jgi:periplasmic divalent cation tolerance protein